MLWWQQDRQTAWLAAGVQGSHINISMVAIAEARRTQVILEQHGFSNQYHSGFQAQLCGSS
jgi:hypothetical protein